MLLVNTINNHDIILFNLFKILKRNLILNEINNKPSSDYVFQIIKAINNKGYKSDLIENRHNGVIVKMTMLEDFFIKENKYYELPNGKKVKRVKKKKKDDYIKILLTEKGPFYSFCFMADDPFNNNQIVEIFSKNTLNINKNELKELINKYNLIYIDYNKLNIELDGTIGQFGEKPGTIFDYFFGV